MKRASVGQLLCAVACVCILQQLLVYLYHHQSSKQEVREVEGPSLSIDASQHAAFHGLHSHTHASLRVAVLIPYTGPALPPWFDLWLHTAATSAPLFDFLLLVTEAPLRATPPNVKMLRLSQDELVERILALDPGPASPLSSSAASAPRALDAAEAVRQLIALQAYSIVELKPALGFLFAAHIPRDVYSHWAFADMDQLMGRLHTHVPAASLSQYDVVTLAFGDNYRMYMRGQMTIHRHDEYVNNLWRECVHLSSFGARLGQWERGGFAKWKFVSAEGCYSRVIADHAVYPVSSSSAPPSQAAGGPGGAAASQRGGLRGGGEGRDERGARGLEGAGSAASAFGNHSRVSLLVLATQLTDAFNAPLDEKETIFLAGSRGHGRGEEAAANAGSLWRCYGHPLSAAIAAAPLPLPMPPSTPLRLTLRDYTCAYWVAPAFQVCLSTVPPYADLSVLGGEIRYADVDRFIASSSSGGAGGGDGGGGARGEGSTSSLTVITDSPNTALGGGLGTSGVGCREGSLSHFQGWKRNFYHHTARVPGGDAGAAVLSESGVLPLVLGPDFSTFSALWGQPPWANTLHPEDIRAALEGPPPQPSADAAGGEAGREGQQQRRRRGRVVSRLAGPEGQWATDYCGAHSDDLKKCVCAVMGGDIEVVQAGTWAAPAAEAGAAGNQGHEGHEGHEGVALLMVAWADAFYADDDEGEGGGEGGAAGELRVRRDSPLFEQLRQWAGPAVLVTARLERDAGPRPSSASAAGGAGGAGGEAAAAGGAAGGARRVRVPGLAHVTLVEVWLGGCLAGLQVLPEGPVLPDQLLLNVALDCAGQEAVLAVPAGMMLRVMDGGGGGKGGGGGGEEEGGLGAAAVLGAMLRAQRGPRPTALLLPSYSLARRADDDAPVSQPRGKYAYVPYPPKGSSCGPRQPSHLYPDSAELLAAVNALGGEAVGAAAGEGADTGTGAGAWAGAGAGRGGLDASFDRGQAGTGHAWGGESYPPLPFSAQDFARSAALAVPVLFSRRACPHGRGFVRFVAELSGPGCFGGSAARVLAGAGYSLRWAFGKVEVGGEGEGGKGGGGHRPPRSRSRSLAVAALVDDRPTAPLLPARSSQPLCGCAFSRDPNAHRALAAALNRFYHRAASLRGPAVQEEGREGGEGREGREGREGSGACPLRDVWSRKAFGALFVEEQRELLGGHAGL